MHTGLARRVYRVLLRFAFHLFYNPFAFTYDFVSAIVSRGHWRNWTRTAIPHVQGTRVLEVPCGTGNLLLDLDDAGFSPIGVDLSSAMLRISSNKIKKQHREPVLVRARAQALPFARAYFQSVVMTFPPGFVLDQRALAEIHRVLAIGGRLIWVDAGRLLPKGAWSRALNRAVDAVSGSLDFDSLARAALEGTGFAYETKSVHVETSTVHVVIAKKVEGL